MPERNVFSLGRRPKHEDQLTEYLAWLIATLPAVGAAVIELALGADSAHAIGRVDISTQERIPGRRLDALLETDTVRLIIESKLDSDYGPGQLEAYAEWLAENTAPDLTRVLMTLTKNSESAVWPVTAQLKVDELGVFARPALWADLHEALGALVETDRLSDLGARLVGEFRDLLAQEGLVPMPPLNQDELATLWHESCTVIDRFHAYYRASEKTIADALGAAARPRGSFNAQQAYKTFWLDSIGSGLAVGIYASGADWELPSGLKREAPVLFAAFWGDAWKDDDGFGAMAEFLESNVPSGWMKTDRYYACPCILRYLNETIGDGPFDDQQSNLASAVAPLKTWVESSFAAVPPKRKRR